MNRNHEFLIPPYSTKSIIKMGALAGLAGGLAEVGWICFLSATGQVSAVAVAKGVTAAIAPSLATHSFGIVMGLGFHLAIAMALGAVMLVLWARLFSVSFSKWWGASFALVTLATVWAVNFHVVLPVLSPQFLDLVPQGLGLVSKLLFALALLGTLYAIGRFQPKTDHSNNILKGD